MEGDGPVYPDIGPEDKDALIARLTLENDILRGVSEVLTGGGLGRAVFCQQQVSRNRIGF